MYDFGTIPPCRGQDLKAQRSGFLGDYSQLKPNEKYEGTMLYENPAKPLKGYNRFIIEPVVVRNPGPGTLKVRTAITQIDKTVPVANIHPAMKMTGLGLGGAALEAEGTDSQSNDRVFAVTDSRKGSRLDSPAGFSGTATPRASWRSGPIASWRAWTSRTARPRSKHARARRAPRAGAAQNSGNS